MKIVNTANPTVKPSVVMMLYGEGGVGKTTFASTAPKPILADCENGAKYFGLRGIKMDVAQIESWSDMKEFLQVAKSDKYETVIIDPIGELMDKLKRFMVSAGDRKLVQGDGTPSMAGWGWLKKTMRDYIKVLRDTGKHIIIVAHVEEKQDDQRLVKRPKVETKLSDELVNIVDIVAYMTVVMNEGTEQRIIYVDPSSDRFVAKDRTGQLGKIIPPDFSLIINACQGTAQYKWMKQTAVAPKKEDESVDKPAPAEKQVQSVKDKLNQAKAKTNDGENN